MGHDAVYGIVLYFVNLGAYMNTAVIIAVVILAAAVGVYFWKRKKKEAPAVETVTEETGTETPSTAIRYEAPIKDGDTVYWYESGVKHEGTVKVLAAGLQVFDADGKKILGTGDSLCRVLGRVEMTTETGSVTVGTDVRIWVAVWDNNLIYDYNDPDNTDKVSYPVNISVKNGVISWNYATTKYWEDYKRRYGTMNLEYYKARTNYGSILAYGGY